jgi:hypothetical protein
LISSTVLMRKEYTLNAIVGNGVFL